MEFHNQEIRDILIALASESRNSIVPDETITGKASFFFSDQTMEQALETFYATFHLYPKKTGGITKVSKVWCYYDERHNTVELKCNEVKLDMLFRIVQNELGTTILYDSLPEEKISIDLKNLAPADALKICMKKFSNYEIESTEEGKCWYIRKKSESENLPKKLSYGEVTRDGEKFSLNVERNSLVEILVQLFNEAHKEYSLFIKKDIILENLHFESKDFNTLLKLILEQGCADYFEKDEIIYVLEMTAKNSDGRFMETEIITPKWISVRDIMTAIPQQTAASGIIRGDTEANRLLLTGTKEEIEKVKKFIETIDIIQSGLKYKKIEIKHLDAQNLVNLIPEKITQVKCQYIQGTNSILASGTEETLNRLENFISEIDSPSPGTPLPLKYIQVDELLKKLPPSAEGTLIKDSGYPNLAFFTGSNEKLEVFKKELELIDRPKPQIKYQLLVIQYSKAKNKSIKPSLGISKNSDDSSIVFGGELSNIMQLNFDVISSFGYLFAANLNAQIAENTANVFTDTTLTGISGQEIKFQNTDTYRYMEYEYDKNNARTTGVTQQITSGLIVGLNGWVSGDDMITMNVNATVSKQNGDNSTIQKDSSIASLPSTSERVITTQVRTPSGQPVIISGLIKEDTGTGESRIPFISKIPLAGWLFKNKVSAKEKSEIVIYIVPHLIKEAVENSRKLENYYNELVKKHD